MIAALGFVLVHGPRAIAPDGVHKAGSLVLRDRAIGRGSHDTLRHALRAMAAEDDLSWVLLPCNHDSLAATERGAASCATRPRTCAPSPRPIPQPWPRG